MATFNTTSSRRKNTKPMVFELDIINPPQPLILLINPSSLEIRYSSKITEQRVRWTGLNTPAYLFHAHHDELDTLSASGKSAMFMDKNGLTRKNRTDTLAYENIESLVSLYRNNGMNMNTMPGKTTAPCAINSVGRVVITYDGVIYKGHFVNFSYAENESSPFNVDFTFEFKVTKTFSIDRINENAILSRIGSL